MIVKQNFSESRLRILFWMKERLKLKNPTNNIFDPPITHTPRPEGSPRMIEVIFLEK